jgi:hypothetical protein
MMSNKSTRSEQSKIRDMQEAMLKLQEQVVNIRIENRTLKKASTAKGKYILKICFSLTSAVSIKYQYFNVTLIQMIKSASCPLQMLK